MDEHKITFTLNLGLCLFSILLLVYLASWEIDGEVPLLFFGLFGLIVSIVNLHFDNNRYLGDVKGA